MTSVYLSNIYNRDRFILITTTTTNNNNNNNNNIVQKRQDTIYTYLQIHVEQSQWVKKTTRHKPKEEEKNILAEANKQLIPYITK